jgi:hypothetical protein
MMFGRLGAAVAFAGTVAAVGDAVIGIGCTAGGRAAVGGCVADAIVIGAAAGEGAHAVSARIRAALTIEKPFANMASVICIETAATLGRINPLLFDIDPIHPVKSEWNNL